MVSILELLGEEKVTDQAGTEIRKGSILDLLDSPETAPKDIPPASVPAGEPEPTDPSQTLFGDAAVSPIGLTGVFPGQMAALAESGMIPGPPGGIDEFGRPLDKSGKPFSNSVDGIDAIQMATAPFEWAAQPTPEAQNFTDWATRVLPTSASKLVPNVARFLAYDLPKPFTDAVLKRVQSGYEADLTSLQATSGAELQEAMRKRVESGTEFMADVGTAIYELADGLARFAGEPLGIYALTSFGISPDPSEPFAQMDPAEVEKFKHKWVADPAAAVLGIAPFIKASLKTGPTMAEKGARELKNEADRMALSEARNDRANRFNEAGSQVNKEIRQDLKNKQVAVAEHTRKEVSGERFDKLFDEAEISVPKEFKSTKTDQAFKTKAASNTRKKQLAEEGIETEAIKTEEGWVLREKVEKIPQVFNRVEESGIPNVDKPQGLYLEKEKFGILTEGIEGNRFEVSTNIKNPLNVEPELFVTHARSRGIPFPASSGIKALKKLVSEKEFNALMNMEKSQLVRKLNREHPDIEWSRYFDSYEVLEGYAGVLAKKGKFDSIIGDIDEIVILDKKAIVDITDTKSKKLIPIDKELPVPERIEAGTFKPENSPFFENFETTQIQKKLYQDPSRHASILNDPEIFTMKMVNDVNRYYHGDVVDIGTVRNNLSELASRAEEMWSMFENPIDHKIFTETVQEAASWARQIRKPGEKSDVGEVGIRLRSGLDPEVATRAVKKMFQKSRDAKKVPLKKKIRDTKRLLKRKFVDPSGNIRVDLEKIYGEEGLRVVEKKILSRGANAKAARLYKQSLKEVYGKLRKKDQELLDDIIFARRVIQIDDIHGEGIKKHPGGLGATEHGMFLESLRKENPNKFQDLMNRADAYFEVMRSQLKQLHDEGLITDKDYNTLKKFDYSRRELVDKIDPEIKFSIGGKRQSVKDSGVQELTKGREAEILETDSQLMMLEVISRTQGRVFNNQANQALLDLSRNNPKSDVVRESGKGIKVPRGWSSVNVFDKGERKTLYMPQEFAKEWIINDPEISYNLSNLMRVVSGSTILRPMATGINLGFAFANLPRDLAHIWMTSQVHQGGKWKSTYNPAAPIALGQMGIDLATVLPDAMLRKGRFDKYIDEGGGMEFLVHQGRLLKRRLGIETKLDKVQDVLGYVNETSEILSRLALRERVIKREAKERGISQKAAERNPDITSKATAAARDYMDFGQGGGITKAVDTAIPYLNASVQGTRGIFRAAIRNPKDFGVKSAQLGALATGLYLANRYINPDNIDSIPEEVQNSNFVITTPWKFTDSRGQERHIYFAVPKDPSQKFMTKFFEFAMQKHLGEDPDPDKIVKTLKELSPVTETNLLPPSAQALMGYAFNKDFWRNEDIWRRGKVDPQEEFVPGKTGTFFVDAGQTTGMSPDRLEFATKRLFTSGNIYSNLVGRGYDALFDDMPEDKREQHIAMILSRAPIAKRFIKVTNPFTKHAEEIEDVTTDVATNRWVNTRELDMLAEGNLFQGNVLTSEITDLIKKVAKKDGKQEADRLLDRFTFQKKIKNLPERTFWLKLQRMNPEARARIFINRWDQAEPDEKEVMKKSMGIIGKGLFTDRFWDEVQKVRQTR